MDCLYSNRYAEAITPMMISTRDTNIKGSGKTHQVKPLIDAYYLMLKEVITASATSEAQKDNSSPLDHILTDNHSSSSALNSSHPLNRSVGMPVRLRQEIEAMHIKERAYCSGGPRRCRTLS
jgi:hypothetical protein